MSAKPHAFSLYRSKVAAVLVSWPSSLHLLVSHIRFIKCPQVPTPQLVVVVVVRKYFTGVVPLGGWGAWQATLDVGFPGKPCQSSHLK